jgi:serine/threonine-protein kinase
MASERPAPPPLPEGYRGPGDEFARAALSVPPPGTPSESPLGPAALSSLPPASASDPLWARRIRVTEELGRGAMCYVVLGKDVRLGRELALKVLPLPRRELPRVELARFVEEAQITAQLEHPNIVPVHDLGLDPADRAYFSMKRIRGRSLETILEQKTQGDRKTLEEFGLRRLLDVFLQVCQAIEYAHAHGVIHRDLKPANIMVGDFGEVLVMDWGVAKVKGRPELESAPPAEGAARVTSVRAGKQAWATQSGTVVGTPAYMSPEQAQGLEVDGRTDVYSLGVILYEILAGQVPFEDEDPKKVLRLQVHEAPRRPSEINPATPLALEALVLRLLAKEPGQRTLSLAQIRAHVHNHIEGIGRDYRGSSLLSDVLSGAVAFALFSFAVWYLTGQSIMSVLAIGPPAVLNAVGWFLLVMALGYPLWAAYGALRQHRAAHDRFRPASSEEVFLSGYLAHRTFAASVAPLFQLAFIVELVTLATAQAMVGQARSADLVKQVCRQMRIEWGQALLTVLVFLFGYLFLLCTEVRFARTVDRYELLAERRKWESVWPFFLIVVLLSTIASTDVLAWVLSSPHPTPVAFLREQVLTQPLNLFDIVKTLVLQGTFLIGLVAATTLLSFPFAEVLAALRMAYQPSDEASVASRWQYFLRSVTVYRVARANWLYGGAVIASLTASTILSTGGAVRLLEKVLYILGPSVIGLGGYRLTRRYVDAFLAQAPCVRAMLVERRQQAIHEQWQADLAQLGQATWRSRLGELAAPVACMLAYLVFTGSGIQEQAIYNLILPVTTKGWLLILPYVLLVPVVLLRDRWRLRRLRQQIGAASPETLETS